MRRLLFLALLVSALVAATAGVAWAQLHEAPAGATASGSPRGTSAPVVVPAAAPHAIDAHGTLSYVSLARLEAAAGIPPADAAESAGPGTVTVSAVVLPVATIEVDAQGRPERITINTTSRDPRALAFLITAGGAATPVVPDAASWRAIRAALAQSRSGVGIVWGA